MFDEQEALAASFPKMMDALSTLEGGLPDLHIGVITTDMGVQNGTGILPPPLDPGCALVGDDGQLRQIPELGSDRFISDIAAADGTRVRNYTGELRDVFAQLATVGIYGCGFEQPLAAVRRALEHPDNAGFLRPEANLAVVILTDEDDCSAAHHDLFRDEVLALGPLTSFRCTQFGVTCDVGGETSAAMGEVGPKAECHASTSSTIIDDVAPYIDLLRGVKDDPYAVMVAVIAGDAEPVAIELGPTPAGPMPRLANACGGETRVADPAVRLAELVAGFPQRGIMTSICDDDLGLPLTSIGYAAKKVVGDPCLDVALADTSPAEGLQPLCDVAEGPLAAEQPLPACDSSTATNCWRLVPDPALCTRGEQQLRLDIRRAHAPAPRTYAHLRCLTK